MKRLYLMRHGHAPTLAESGVKSDALRPLSDKGHRDVRKMGAEILRRGGAPELTLHSPLLRAAQTAAALKGEREAFPPLDNTRPPAEVLAALRERGATIEELLAVGHQPQIGELSFLLTGALFEIRPAGVVAVELFPRPRPLWSLNVDELD